MRSLLALRQLQAGVVRAQRAALPAAQPPSTPLPCFPREPPRRPLLCAATPATAAAAAPLAPPPAARAPACAAAAAAACFTGCGGAPSLGWSANFAARYTVGAEVGRGSFGVVHVAVATDTGRHVAVKVLPKCRPSPGCSSGASPQCTGGGAQQPGGSQHLEAIEREAETWEALQGSPFVARLEGLYEDSENAYLVSELCGGTVKALLDERGGHLGEHEAAAVMRGVLDVLCECHRRSFAYGDVKPANFLVCPDCESAGGVSVRAVDFGCSRPVPLTQPCGSPLFMAPEMAGRRFGTAVDVWAAGVMLHILLVGRPPFWSNKSAEEAARLPAYAIVAATRTHDISYPRSDWGRLSREARQLVEAMLTRDPAARITAGDALAHPWFARALGFSPAPPVAAEASDVQAEEEQGAAAAAEAAVGAALALGPACVAAAACA